MISSIDQQSVEVRKGMRGGPGEVTVRQYFKPDQMKAKCRLCGLLTIPPGAGIGLHQHTAEDEVYIILKGSGLLDEGGVKSRVSAGDAVLTGSGQSHAVTNDGSEPMEIVAVIMCY
jgi:mannose-6-phosphate isomerase-like protein (cupin superfamily)